MFFLARCLLGFLVDFLVVSMCFFLVALFDFFMLAVDIPVSRLQVRLVCLLVLLLELMVLGIQDYFIKTCVVARSTG